jgi:predicted nucleic acid-binding protein
MKKISDVFSKIRRVGLDSDCIIYFVDQNPEFDQRMTAIFQEIVSGKVSGLTSTLALTEGLVVPLRNADVLLAQRYRDLLLNSEDFQVLPVDAVVAEIAADIRAKYNMRTPDAIQIATALNAGCDAFLTNNGRDFRRVSELTVLVLNELEL